MLFVNTANTAKALEEAAKNIGLKIDFEKIKMIKLIEIGEDPNEMENLNYENLVTLNI